MLRLKWMIQFANTENVTWDYTPVGYWSTLEVHVGIIIACLPALRSLQHRIFPATKTPASYYNGPSGAYGSPSKGSPFPSIAKWKGRGDLTTTASQASMMRSRDRTKADKEFIQLDEYEIRVGSDVDSETERDRKDSIGRGKTDTRVECGSVESPTFLDTSSVNRMPDAAYIPLGARNNRITVKKEVSVDVEYHSARDEAGTRERENGERRAQTMGRSVSIRSKGTGGFF